MSDPDPHTTSNASSDDVLTEEELLEAWEEVRPPPKVQQIQRIKKMVLQAGGRISYTESHFVEDQIFFMDPRHLEHDPYSQPTTLIVIHPPGQREQAQTIVRLLQGGGPL